MKYEIKFSCGHTETVELFGKGSDREKKIKYFEEYGVCSACYKKERAEEAQKGCIEIKMPYTLYKGDYEFCDTVGDSYDKQEKTIIVLVPEALAEFRKAKTEGGTALYDAAIKVATNNKNKQGKHYKECYEVVKAYIKANTDFAKGLQTYMKEKEDANKIVISNITIDEEKLVRMYLKQFDVEINDDDNKLTIRYKNFHDGSLINEYIDCLAKVVKIFVEKK